MKTKFTMFLLLTMAGLSPASSALAQVIIQHSGAADPVSEGFSLNSSGDPQLGPAFGDLGFDSWIVHSRDHNEAASYSYFLTPDEQQAVTTYGLMTSANVRFVEVSDYAQIVMSFQAGTTRFRLVVSANDNGEIIVSGDGIQPFSVETNALDYHEYDFIYDAVSETAALWIDGVEWVTGISGFQTFPVARVGFGATGEDITYSHWNEVTFAIVPEPATVALLTGLGALAVAGAVRWRRLSDRS